MCAAQGLDFAIGVGVGGFEHQVLGLLAGRNGLDHELAAACFAQRQGEFVGNHQRIGAGAVFFVAFIGRFVLRAAWRVEAEFAEVVE